MIITPGKQKVILTPNSSRVNSGVIAIPELSFNSSVALIQKAGPNCHRAIQAGRVALTSLVFSEKKFQIIHPESGTFICGAGNIFAIVKNERIFPLGRTVLVRRLVEEQRYGDIIIPEAQRTTDQTLDCIIEQFGLPFDGDHSKVLGLRIGDKVRLRKWEHHMIDLSNQGKYLMIVNEDDIIGVMGREEKPKYSSSIG